ncbi:MAG: hypothetical protein ACTSQ8_07780 [Candidatus Helarchaeota archaeon]
MKDEEKKELYEKAWTKWGADAQLTMIMEESAELIHAVAKYFRHPDHIHKMVIVEEMADVSIMTEQFLQIMDLHKEYNVLKNVKLERLREKLREK